MKLKELLKDLEFHVGNEDALSSMKYWSIARDLSRRLKKAMEAIGLLTSNGAPCETCYEAGCTGNSSCFDCRDGGDLTCHDRAYEREQKASALIREIKGSE